MTDEYCVLLDHIDRVVQFVNDNGGWSVVGWYKCGVIYDRTLVSNNSSTSGSTNNGNNGGVRVDNGEINYHVIEILPSNREIMTDGPTLNRRLNQMK